MVHAVLFSLFHLSVGVGWIGVTKHAMLLSDTQAFICNVCPWRVWYVNAEYVRMMLDLDIDWNRGLYSYCNLALCVGGRICQEFVLTG